MNKHEIVQCYHILSVFVFLIIFGDPNNHSLLEWLLSDFGTTKQLVDTVAIDDDYA